MPHLRCCGVLILLLGLFSGCDRTPETPEAASGVVEEKPAPEAAAAFTVAMTPLAGYTPGTANTIQVRMNYTGSEPVTALALQTTLPQGWTYAGIRGTLKPAIDPPAGTTNELTLIWIQIPEFPATVEFALEVPEWAEGTYTLSHRAIYRTLGGELQSPLISTELASAG